MSKSVNGITPWARSGGKVGADVGVTPFLPA